MKVQDIYYNKKLGEENHIEIMKLNTCNYVTIYVITQNIFFNIGYILLHHYKHIIFIKMVILNAFYVTSLKTHTISYY